MLRTVPAIREHPADTRVVQVVTARRVGIQVVPVATARKVGIQVVPRVALRMRRAAGREDTPDTRDTRDTARRVSTRPGRVRVAVRRHHRRGQELTRPAQDPHRRRRRAGLARSRRHRCPRPTRLHPSPRRSRTRRRLGRPRSLRAGAFRPARSSSSHCRPRPAAGATAAVAVDRVHDAELRRFGWPMASVAAAVMQCSSVDQCESLRSMRWTDRTDRLTGSRTGPIHACGKRSRPARPGRTPAVRRPGSSRRPARRRTDRPTCGTS